MNDEIKNKLENIDLLLNNNEKLIEYINNIDNSNVDIPPDLEKNLLNNFSKKYNKQKNTFIDNSIKIFKIVACTTFALVIWNISLSKTPNNNYENYTTNKNDYKIYENINNKFKNFSELLLTPINIERND